MTQRKKRAKSLGGVFQATRKKKPAKMVLKVKFKWRPGRKKNDHNVLYNE